MRRIYLALLVAACGSPAKPAAAPTSPAPVAPAATPAPVASAPAPVAAARPPATPARPVVDTYHGVAVTDPYRWLEADDAEVRAWSAAQNVYARRILDHLPEVEALRTELHDIIAAPITLYGRFRAAGGKLFAMRKLPTHEQPALVVMTDPAKAADATLVLDPAAAGGAQQEIDWFVPSPDGTKVAISISRGGSEEGTLHVIDLHGKDLEPPIPDVQRGTGGGDVAWTPDSKGFYYTRYPAAGEKPASERSFWMQVWFHALGATRDRYELGKGLPKIAEITLDADRRGRVIASVQNGDGGTFRHYLRDGKTWRQLDDWNDGIVWLGFGPTRDLWLVSHAHAPHGKIMRLRGNAKSAAEAKLVVAEGKDAIVTSFPEEWGLVATRDRLFAVYQLGGPSEVRAFTLAGKAAAAPAMPPVSTASLPVAWHRGVLVGATSFTTPWTFGFFDPARGKLTPLPAISRRAPVDLSGFEVSREMATSKDGTQIPVNIVWPRGARKDGSTPCVVTGYGGFGIDEAPRYLGTWAPLLRRGVCFVDVNLRGGGEFGEAWHAAGARVHKQNVFDDFTAALELLISRKYSSADRLGIVGGSNGGLLMGAIVTQHPELVHAVASEVGIYDMLRVELSPNGSYNVTEYGTVKDPDQFKALYAYSPYHHVARAKYPAILMTTGANDPRVSPWQSRKMTAALQAAQLGDAPILLRTTDKAGHGFGTSMSERISLLAHVQAFLLAELRPAGK